MILTIHRRLNGAPVLKATRDGQNCRWIVSCRLQNSHTEVCCMWTRVALVEPGCHTGSISRLGPLCSLLGHHHTTSVPSECKARKVLAFNTPKQPDFTCYWIRSIWRWRGYSWSYDVWLMAPDLHCYKHLGNKNIIQKKSTSSFRVQAVWHSHLLYS